MWPEGGVRYWDGEVQQYDVRVAYTCGKNRNFISAVNETYERAFRECQWDGTWKWQRFDECQRKLRILWSRLFLHVQYLYPYSLPEIQCGYFPLPPTSSNFDVPLTVANSELLYASVYLSGYAYKTGN